MKTLFYSKQYIRGKIVSSNQQVYTDNSIIYIDSPRCFSISMWLKFSPICILINESSVFSHLVSYCISNEISLAIVTKEELSTFINKNIIIDLKNNIIAEESDKDSYIDSEDELTDQNLNVVNTKDNIPIELFASVKNIQNAKIANKLGVKSAGLISTEFFQVSHFLSYDDCLNTFSSICEYFKYGTSSIRLFDYDNNKMTNQFADKYQRGIRAYRNKEIEAIIDNQIACCAQLSKKYKIEIILPFVTNSRDICFIRKKFEQLNINLPICVMIENPAAYMSIEQFSHLVNSFSVGTNDLLQYFFAFNRDSICEDINYINPYSKSLINFLNIFPCQFICQTRVCGQLPLYPYMLHILIQIGFRKFSVPSPILPLIANKIKNIEIDKTFFDNIDKCITDNEIKDYIYTHMIE